MGVATRQAMEKGPEVVSLGGEVNLNLNSKSITSKLENVCDEQSREHTTPSIWGSVAAEQSHHGCQLKAARRGRANLSKAVAMLSPVGLVN